MTQQTAAPVRIERSPKRLRTYLGGALIADTDDARLVWEVPPYPAYYLPKADVDLSRFTPNGRTRASETRGEAQLFDVSGGDGKVAVDAAWHYPESPVTELRDLVRIDWRAMDHWFEEDEEVFIHPRSPYTRIDVLPTSRRVEVSVNGVKVIDTTRAMALFETGRPPRYYVPTDDIRMDLLEATDTVTGCPYKGFASYWTVHAGDQTYPDLAWSYKTPLPESARIAELVCIWDTHVETRVDGRLV
jgi:uncharacterized protein (DUF427 family)